MKSKKLRQKVFIRTLDRPYVQVHRDDFRVVEEDK